MKNNLESKRFTPSGCMQWIIPVLLALLFLGMLFALGLVVFSLLGLIPGS